MKIVIPKLTLLLPRERARLSYPLSLCIPALALQELLPQWLQTSFYPKKCPSLGLISSPFFQTCLFLVVPPTFCFMLPCFYLLILEISALLVVLPWSSSILNLCWVMPHTLMPWTIFSKSPTPLLCVWLFIWDPNMPPVYVCLMYTLFNTWNQSGCGWQPLLFGGKKTSVLLICPGLLV